MFLPLALPAAEEAYSFHALTGLLSGLGHVSCAHQGEHVWQVAVHLRPAALLLGPAALQLVHHLLLPGSPQLVSVGPPALAGIVIGEICRTVKLVSSPYHWPFEILWIVYWLSILVIIMSFTGLLVLLPNWDTIRARQVRYLCTLILLCRHWFTQGCWMFCMPGRNAIQQCCTSRLLQHWRICSPCKTWAA